MLYESREAVIKLFNDYSSIAYEAKYKSIHGEELKILTPKQMLQRLTIALAQVKARNTSENLLNEFRKLYILCMEQNKLLKKYIIIKSIKL